MIVIGGTQSAKAQDQRDPESVQKKKNRSKKKETQKCRGGPWRKYVPGPKILAWALAFVT
jgi:hypothetical protein